MPASTSQGNDDGWDSSLERLWELEQQAEVTPDLLSTSRTFHRQGSDADQAATVAVRAKASQRRLQNRKLAQKRYRERQKASVQAIRAHT